MSMAIGILLLFLSSLLFFSYPRRKRGEEPGDYHIYGHRYSDRYRSKPRTLFPSGYDSALRASVTRDLSAHRGFAGVKVSVREGQVQLEGRVRSEREAETAASLAQSVPFVRGVQNHLSWDAAREQTG
jgi:hypothetical protein